MKHTGRKLTSWLLSLAMLLPLVPAFSMTALAYEGNPYTGLVNTTTAVNFNGIEWYIIADGSEAANAGTVTLLSKNLIGNSKFNSSNSAGNLYGSSTIKSYLDNLTAQSGSFYDVSSAIVDVDLEDVNVTGAKLWLLSTSEAQGVDAEVRKCSANWWLRSPSPVGSAEANKKAMFIDGGNGGFPGDVNNLPYVDMSLGVRPALKLDLSKVTFDSDSNTFSVASAVTEYPLWVGGTQVTSANATDTEAHPTWSYAAESRTLTLNGFSYTIPGSYPQNEYIKSGIHWTGTDDLNIVLTGTNTFAFSSGDYANYGIRATSGGIVISGEGTLNVNSRDNALNTSGTLTINSGKITASAIQNYAIIASQGLIINSGELTASTTAGQAAISGSVTNAIPGTGWTNPAGTEGQAAIAISTTGQSLTYKKVQFPAALDPVAYIDHNATTGAAETKSCTSYTAFVAGTNNELTTVPAGWYVIKAGNAVATKRLVVSGEVNLILCDGATLIANKGIQVATGNTLNIYAGSTGTTITGNGALTARNSDGHAGIGGNENGACGTVNIHGGTINASNNLKAAGIGGGNGGAGGTVTIYGGTVTAIGNGEGKGIGAGQNGSTNGTLTLGTGVTLETSTDNSEWTDTTSDTTVRTQYMRTTYTPHTHNWSYALSTDGKTITATCGEGCDITTGLTLTISAPTGSLIYDGTTTYPATLSTGYNTTAFPGEIAISYTKNGAVFTGTPTEAGAYVASVTAGGKTASVTYTITAAEQSAPALTITAQIATPAPTTVTVPVSGEDNTVNVSVTVSGETATVKDTDIDAVLSETAGTGTVSIDVSDLGTEITEAVIPAAMVGKIADAVADANNDADGLEVKLSTGSVTFDAEAVEAIANQMTGSDLKLNLDGVKVTELTSAQQSAVSDLEVEVVVDAYLTSNGQRISDFGGGSATVKVPYVLKDGQFPAGLTVWYVASDGTRTQVPATYDGENIVFDVPHFSNYVVAYDAEQAADANLLAAYRDLDQSQWYADGVKYALKNGVMQGMGDGTFAPNGNTTRAQLATILWNIEGKQSASASLNYSDVIAGGWYENAIRWAVGASLMDGYGDGTFGPDDALTREQLVTILYRYAKLKGVDVSVGEDTNILSYADAFQVSEWAISAFQWACGSGIVNGVGGKLDPSGSATRAQIATIIMRYQTEIAK